jgi:hypothetical protein
MWPAGTLGILKICLEFIMGTQILPISVISSRRTNRRNPKKTFAHPSPYVVYYIRARHRSLHVDDNITSWEDAVNAAHAAGADRPWDKRLAKSDPSKVEVSAIQDKTREIARLAMIGWSTKAIAEFIGMDPQQVSAIRHSSLFRSIIDELQEKRDESAIDFRQDLERLIPEAINTYEEVLTGPQAPPSLRVKVAGEVLDRSGFAPVRQSIIQSVNTRLSMEDIADIRNRAEEARRRRQEQSIDIEVATSE